MHQDHLLRSIDRFVDLSRIRTHVAEFYSHTGRSSIDPELLIRMRLVGYLKWSHIFGKVYSVSRAYRERWSCFLDQFTANLRWIRVSFRLLISSVLFCFRRPHLASISRGWNADARSCSRSAIFRSRHAFLNLSQRHSDTRTNI